MLTLLTGVNVSWWTTAEGPEGGARVLPFKLRVCHILARTLVDDPEVCWTHCNQC